MLKEAGDGIAKSVFFEVLSLAAISNTLIRVGLET